jgi:hypothetical protein
MFKRLRLLIFIALIGGAAAGYYFWGNLTPGEQHHLKDHAKKAVEEGDATDLKDAVKFKAGEELDSSKRRLKEKASELGKKARAEAENLKDAAKEELRKEAIRQLENAAPDGGTKKVGKKAPEDVADAKAKGKK